MSSILVAFLSPSIEKVINGVHEYIGYFDGNFVVDLPWDDDSYKDFTELRKSFRVSSLRDVLSDISERFRGEYTVVINGAIPKQFIPVVMKIGRSRRPYRVYELQGNGEPLTLHESLYGD